MNQALKTFFSIFFIFLIAPALSYANAFLPLYSAGFDFTTLIVFIFPLAAFEAILLKVLLRNQNPFFVKPSWRVSLSANLYSAFIGSWIAVFAAAFLMWAWGSFGMPSHAVLFMRQLFLASYVITVLIEAAVFQKKSHEGFKFWPSKRAWFLSFAVNSISYGLLGWCYSLGILRDEDTAPTLWYFISRMFSRQMH